MNIPPPPQVSPCPQQSATVVREGKTEIAVQVPPVSGTGHDSPAIARVDHVAAIR